MSQTAIKIQNLGKRYQLGEQNDIFTFTEYLSNSFKSLLGKEINKKKTQEFWALKNISYTLEQGQILGVVGKNGSGKSTLLKILSRITPPSQGEFKYKGTMSSLLEVGTGFKPELTGYDNIFLSGTILGMKKHEIKSCLEEIIEFSEIGQFINTPVKRYSSGMYVRLAFAVAAHLDPDILLIDEVLAVGDMKFQRKCLERMGSVAKEGRTVIFVSHNMQAVSQLCTQAMLLHKSELIDSGDVSHVVEKYQDLNLKDLSRSGAFEFTPKNDSLASITKIKIGNPDQYKLTYDILEEIAISVEFENSADLDNLMVELGVYSLDGMCVFYSRELDYNNFTQSQQNCQISCTKGRYICNTTIPIPLLNSGFYELQFRLASPPHKYYDYIKDIQIHVTDLEGSFSSCITKSSAHGVITQALQWERNKA